MYEEILNWLRNYVREQGLQVRIHEVAQTDDPYLYIPAHVAGEIGVYQRAQLLQQVEDAWNNRVPAPPHRVLLVPSRD